MLTKVDSNPATHYLLESFIENRKRRLTESLTGQELYFTKRCKLYLQYLDKMREETLNTKNSKN